MQHTGDSGCECSEILANIMRIVVRKGLKMESYSDVLTKVGLSLVILSPKARAWLI